MRIFISVELPDTVKDRIERVVEKLKLLLTPIKWVEKGTFT